MTNLHRREVLGGLAMAAVGASLVRAQPTAVIATSPPAEGPLSSASVAALLAQHKVPGVSLAIVERGAIVATYGYGSAQTGRLVTPQTRFQAASISKTVNALAVLKLGRGRRVPPRRSGQSASASPGSCPITR